MQHPRSDTWVCFACRHVVRAPWSETPVRCGLCGQPCRSLGSRIEVPRKADLKAWRDLQQFVAERHRRRTGGRDEYEIQ